jgi:hypothetical protein
MPAKHPQALDAANGLELTVLEQNISMAIGGQSAVFDLSSQPRDRKTMIADLHRLASLIYINRTAHKVSGTAFQHTQLVRQALLLLTKLGTCQNAWPLFIIACEANNDEQRLAVMQVFECTQKDQRQRSNHIHLIRHMVEAVWSQRDLDEDGQVDFEAMFDAVIRAVPFIPPFA